jgi:hypothetical protein
MTATLPTTVVGVFTDAKQAEGAVADLRRVGFGPDQIGVAHRHPEVAEAAPHGSARHAAEGGVAGAVAGGFLGGALGAAVVLVPGIGPVIGLGLLAVVAGGATAGVVAGGLAGTLIGLGIPEDEAHYYHGEVEAGRTLVTVQAPGRYDEAVRILRVHGAYGKGKPLI